MRALVQKQMQPHKPAFLGSNAGRQASQAKSGTCEVGLNNAAPPLFGHDFGRIPVQALGAETVQRQTEPASNEKEQRAELAFRGTIGFKIGGSEISQSSPRIEEGFTFFAVQWEVKNIGWTTAPEHVDRATIYNAERCSGCRDEKDEFFSLEVTVPPIVSDKQPGEHSYAGISPVAGGNIPFVGTNIPAGRYDIYVDLDVYDEVEEINENNNTAFTQLVVLPRNKRGPETEEE
ncbi:MAG: hypothetical protein FJ316_07205 [SAR202 cluster bacterium]|nr:hypothetical protein [SAR202 cluster bacterium]